MAKEQSIHLDTSRDLIRRLEEDLQPVVYQRGAKEYPEAAVVRLTKKDAKRLVNDHNAMRKLLIELGVKIEGYSRSRERLDEKDIEESPESLRLTVPSNKRQRIRLDDES